MVPAAAGYTRNDPTQILPTPGMTIDDGSEHHLWVREDNTSCYLEDGLQHRRQKKSPVHLPNMDDTPEGQMSVPL